MSSSPLFALQNVRELMPKIQLGLGRMRTLSQLRVSLKSQTVLKWDLSDYMMWELCNLISALLTRAIEN